MARHGRTTCGCTEVYRLPPGKQKLDIEELEINCQHCTLTDLCLPRGMDQHDLTKLDDIVARKPPYHRGDHLFPHSLLMQRDNIGDLQRRLHAALIDLIDDDAVA